MLRWMILLTSLLVWIGSMALVYIHFRPRPGLDAEAQAALEERFDENAETSRSWKIFADLAEAGGPPRRGIWDGSAEGKLEKVGVLRTVVHDKKDASLDEETILDAEIPGTGIHAHFSSSSRITLEQGLENSRVSLRVQSDKLDFDTLSVGVRDGSSLNITTDIRQNGQPIYRGKKSEVLNGKVLPTVELAPFQRVKFVDVGKEWNVQVLDFETALKGEGEFAKTIHVKCIGKSLIHYEGELVNVYEVRSDGGEERAWYSPDGIVLKQTFRLGGLVRVMVVRDLPPEQKGRVHK